MESMGQNVEFVEFPKMARLSRDVVITEKLNGTNAQVCFTEDGQILAGSRTRWITPEDDNFGFAAWVRDNVTDLLALGPGRHFGEWWGRGIQSGYGLTERRFSLFNVARWHRAGAEPYVSQGADPRQPPKLSTELPACCHVVPVLYRGVFDTSAVDACLEDLRVNGSRAAPGFMRPEGVVVFHIQGGVGFKKTLGGDGHKGTKP